MRIKIITITIVIIILIVAGTIMNKNTKTTEYFNQNTTTQNQEQEQGSIDTKTSGTTTTSETSKDIQSYYTLADISKHNSPSDCWILIDKNVIDATSYIASGKHPNNDINKGCGKDATEMFNEVRKHAGRKAQDLIMQNKIGTIKL